MALSQSNILVGKSYRTTANEVREVNAIENNEVVYRSVFTTAGAGMTVRTPDKRVALTQFAAEAQSEV